VGHLDREHPSPEHYLYKAEGVRAKAEETADRIMLDVPEALVKFCYGHFRRAAQ
jgi:hypothetical protein